VSRKIWQFKVGREQHIVDLQWNWFSLAGKVIVDGRLVERWGTTWLPWGPTVRLRNIHFQVGGKPAMVAFIVKLDEPNQQELYVDGVLMRKRSRR
jgi:hypothetical protein